MPNADSQDFEAELVLLREQVQAQIEAHRIEVREAFQFLSSELEATSHGGELDAIRARVTEWERRESRLVERIAAKTIEQQVLAARSKLELYRLQHQIRELEGLLALRDSAMRKLKDALEALMAEHSECSRTLRAAN